MDNAKDSCVFCFKTPVTIEKVAAGQTSVERYTCQSCGKTWDGYDPPKPQKPPRLSPPSD
jgi:hypothetical protein